MVINGCVDGKISRDNEDAVQGTTDTPEEIRDSVEDESLEKQEKSPEEMARLKRQYVLMELVETEKDYVRDLSSVVDGYIANLERMGLPEDLVGKDKIIFANIAQILEFHKNFLKEIEKCLDNYEVAGSAFVKYKGRLETMYVRYCQNKPKSDYLVSQEDFEQFFAETKAKLGHKVALCDLLIKPVQRIMKYQLLLKDILKFTERAKEKTDVLKKALAVMHVVPKACDDMMQVGRLQNFDGSLNAQGKLLYQGTLPISDSQGGTSQKSKERRIFLFEQSVIIADHIPPKKEFGNPIYIFKNQIMVNKMLFEPSVADDPLKFIIRSSDPTQPTAFIATAQTLEEKNEWVRYIGEQLDQQKRMLAALVDPRRFMDDLSGSPSGGVGAGAVAGGSSRLGSGSSKSGSQNTTKPDSPKKESKSGKLFGFGKKTSAKSPTSPPAGKKYITTCFIIKVEILDVCCGFSRVLKMNGTVGIVPSYFLGLADIPGDTLAEQISYRRMWHTVVDEVVPTDYAISPLTNNHTSPPVLDRRPLFVVPLTDQRVREGDTVVLLPQISSVTAFTVVWRGPAVQAGRAQISSDNESTRLTIFGVSAIDDGAYSVVAENEYGITSSLAVISVITRPGKLKYCKGTLCSNYCRSILSL
ncbi:unnamed protein product [Angiostrongylus costaricensis]|uniref:DH domain-containing protein n=1 Tax=Angiostrongylus costaricensis TaxID=334426 RepID=A0A3P7I1P3_ANGCS|nr:unnamed protein product [Angiostrongylus costaricensis]